MEGSDRNGGVRFSWMVTGLAVHCPFHEREGSLAAAAGALGFLAPGRGCLGMNRHRTGGSGGAPFLDQDTRGGEPFDCGIVEAVLAQHFARVLREFGWR